MTDKQFSSLRTNIIGAALFIGGAVLLGKIPGALLILLIGVVMMLKDALEDWLKWFNETYPPIDEEKEKEGESK